MSGILPNKLLRFSFTLLSIFILTSGMAQEHVPDTTRYLDEVTIKAFAYNRPIHDIPAAVVAMGKEEFQRFNAATFVPAMNTAPGVRFEERSPGSYRISIRGSSIRSPFGVRNVKVYWNEIPLTDPGGNTYFNQLDPAMMGSIEVVKGPGSSLYGAGTGGVLLLNSPIIQTGRAIQASLQVGSFGSALWHAGYEDATDKASHQVQVMHFQSDGYREQTQLFRDVVNSVFRFELDDRQVLETFIFYSDLFYETPGGLTLTEFEQNSRQARPATATLPGAVEQRARVSLKSFYTGVAHEYFFGSNFHNRTSVYGNLVNFKNAAIRNVDHRNEQSLGARSVTSFRKSAEKIQMALLGGGEFQAGFMPVKSYQNNQGAEGALLSDDEISVLQYSVFGQGELLWSNFSATAGASINGLQYTFQRLSDVGSPEEQMVYTPKLMPRLALLFTPNKVMSVYGSVSRGFSPPTLAEINASNGVFNRDLEAETGTNYELGIRKNWFRQIIKSEITGFFFALDETIVIRREDDGSEYFVNAGETKQKGIEFKLSVVPVIPKNSFVSNLSIWTSYAYNDFRFGDYIKGQDDFSGNQLTGTPAHVVSGGADVALRSGVYFRATIIHTGKLPLNDANAVYADAYTLPGFRVGYQNKRLEIYAGGDNLLDQTYSLGNDLNAVGGRYYNAAPARNFFGGLKINLAF
ncbi:MAG: TonB-dependent receptor [Cyclobacteriaceae bacterium]|nr:TonB-dependent receptor [Cyclobacteriaceae bacterium]